MDKDFLPGLAVLRGFAALWVFSFHAPVHLNHFFGMGMFGVYLFFVLSGFLMTLIIKNGVTVKNFLIKRIFRIYPLFWVCIAIYLFYQGNYPADLWKSLLAHALMLHNDVNAYIINNVLWTLGTEFQFYLLMACLIPDLKNYGDKAWWSLAFILILICFISRLWMFYHYPLDYDRMKHSVRLSNTMALFGAGILVYQIRQIYREVIERYFLFFLAMCIPVLYASFLFAKAHVEDFWHCFASSVGSVFYFAVCFAYLVLIFSCVPKKYYIWIDRLHLTFWGTISYAFYLFHLLIIRLYIRFLPHGIGEQLGIWDFILMIVMTASVSYVLYRLIEKPCIQLGRKITS